MKFLVPFLLVASQAFANIPAPKSHFEEIVDFFRKKVQGNTIEMNETGPSFDEKYTVNYKRTLSFGKVKERSRTKYYGPVKVQIRAFSIDVAGTIHQTSTPKASQQQQAGEEFKDEMKINRVLELTERLSSNRLVGYMRTTSEDEEKVLGEADILIADFFPETGEVRLTDSNAGFVDETRDGVNFISVSRANDYVLKIEDDKLVMDQKMFTYLVDPNSLAMEHEATHELKSTQLLGLPRMFWK